MGDIFHLYKINFLTLIKEENMRMIKNHQQFLSAI